MSSAAGIAINNYIIEDEIGRGTSGRVFKARPRAGPPGRPVAIKFIAKKQLSQAAKDNLVNEISALKTLKHKFIVNMMDFGWDAQFIYIVMEHCNAGDLSVYIKKRRALPEHVARTFCQQLCAALLFMRRQNISHMDLKPSNLLLHAPLAGAPPLLKVADFGFAHCLEEEGKEAGLRGSPLYMAPEMILKKTYDAKADIWSVGVILYEALYGRAPYASPSLEELLVRIKEDRPVSLPAERTVSRDCRDFLTRCLQRHPADRLSFDELGEHPFLDLEHSVPGPNTVARLNIALDAATAADRNKDTEVAVECYEKALKYLRCLTYYADEEMTRNKYQASLVAYKKRLLTLRTAPTGLESEDSQRYDQLVDLCRVTPGLRDGLEICSAARHYQMEGDLSQAIERYTAGLGLLVPLLQSEPRGRRRDLLRLAVSDWLAQAESVKSRLEVESQHLAESATTENSQEKNCSIQ